MQQPEYPKYVFNEKGESKLVDSASELVKLKGEWRDSPAEFKPKKAAKKAPVANPDDDMEEVDQVEAPQPVAGVMELDGKSKAELQAMCKAQGLAIRGKKADLIARLH